MQATKNSRNLKVLLTLGGGGHRFQAIMLGRKLQTQCELSFVTGSGSSIPDDPLIESQTVMRIRDVSTMRISGVLSRIGNTLAAVFDAYKVIRSVRPDIVVAIGTSLAVPLLLAAKILGKKTIFVESITRVNTPTTTGKILSRLRFADRIYVQWPEAVRLYSRSHYAGSIL